MLRNVKQFSKLGPRQQSRRLKQLLATQVESVRSQAIMSRPSLSGPSIIRIVPSSCSKKVLPVKHKAKTLIINKAKTIKLDEIPSTSSLHKEAAAHEQDHKYESENVQEYEEYEVIADDDAQYIEEREVNRSKPIFIPVKQSNENCVSTVPEKINKVHSQQCCSSCRETLDIILKQQQEILNYLKKSEQGILPTDRLLDLLPTMPFDDINDFLDFDESLASNEKVQDQFLVKLRRLLVSNEQKSISNIMSTILTNELCRKISWTGIKNSVTFGSSNMVALIIDLVQQYHDLDIDVIKSRIAEWLRRCGDRISNENRKNKKKLESDVQL